MPAGNRAIRSGPAMVVVPLLYSLSGAALPDSVSVFPLASQALIAIAAPAVDREPDISVIFIEFREPTELATNFVVPMVYPLGMFRVPSVLLVTFVMIYLEESVLNEYRMGVPVGKRVARSEPVIVVVPLLYSFSAATPVDSGITFPLASHALTTIVPPEEEKDPDISVILMEFRVPMVLKYV